ncbi:hypothetical protein C8F04DRAFT_1231237 [Mycena alexandri]|uniref:Uncharacterized protein n=1 Tax=Mycena alexandri TaxID=1745969 RepID=A0AAD6X5G9_9AGAR|nr:hypothetical protein C8F04DRAFT_1231237 [Mycena alexandri]
MSGSRTEMDRVASAIDVLKKVSSKSKNTAIQLAVGELKSVLALLRHIVLHKSSSSSTDRSDRISKIFRKKLSPLYVAFPAPMCQFAAAVIGAIFREKIEPASKAEDFDLQFRWELAQKSVVGSIFDFVDDTADKNKSAVATALNGPLCDIFFRTSFKWTCITLVSNVTQLLTETATNNGDNQSQLRTDKILGAKRIGVALSRSRDYVVIDSLIYLIGALLPARQATEKRTDFVNGIFTSELFPRSAQIKSLIGASSSTDWDPVAAQIINECLAKDLSYPQPFYISGLRTSTPQSNIVDPLFIDNKGLFANTEEAGMVDSYQVPFSTMDRIKISGPGGTSTQVSIQFNAAPRVGAEVDLPAEKTLGAMSFHLKNTDATRFLETLKARGMSHLISDPKISKLAEGGLSLEFNSSEGKPATQQEKVAKVEQLWQSNASRGAPTSPLVGHSSKEPSDKHDTSDAAHSDSRDASSQHDAIYGEELSDMSDDEERRTKAKASKAKAPPAPRALSPAVVVSSASRSRVRIVLDSDEEDDKAPVEKPPRNAAPRKSAMKKLSVESDELESSLVSNPNDQDFEPTQSVPEPVADAPPPRVTRGAAKKNPALAEEPVTSKPSGRSKVSATATKRDVDVDNVDAPEPARSIRRPAGKKPTLVDDELSMSEEEDEMPAQLMVDVKPAARTSAKAKENSNANAKDKPRTRSTDKGADKVSTTKAVETEAALYKPGVDAKSRKRLKVDDDEDDQDVAEDADVVADRRTTKRLRGAIDDQPGPFPRSDSAIVFGTAKPPPAKKRYGGKKGRTSSPPPDAADDTDMAVDYDEPPAAPEKVHAKTGKVAPKKAAKQEPVNDGRKGRVAAMKGKVGQNVGKPVPASKAPQKSKIVPTEKAKAAVQTETANEDDIELVSDEEVKPTRRSTRATKAEVPSKPTVPVVEDVPKPKAKQEKKPRKAPWEDMHLKKKDAVVMHDAVIPSEPPAGSDTFEEYEVPLKGSASSDPPVIPQDDVPMLDLTHGDTPPPKAKKVQLEDITVPDDFTSALDSAFALHADPMSAVPVDSIPVDSAPAIPTAASARSPLLIGRPTVDSKSATVKAVLTTPIRPQTFSSPVAKSEPLLPLPMAKFKSEVPSRPQKMFTPSPIRPTKLPSPVHQPTPPNRMPLKKPPTPLHPSPPPVHQVAPPRSPAPTAHRKILDDSPFPRRVHETTAFVPSRASPLSVQRKTHSSRMPNNDAYDHTPDSGRPARTFVRVPPKHKADTRDHDYNKRSYSPMQGIVEILGEIQTVVIERISRRFDDVQSDVRAGRDAILRGAAENLESMCAESEAHFNTLVDFEEEYAAYHRKIIMGWDDMHNSAEAMSKALGQIIQQHDRHSLSKKLPPTMFTVPAILRKPISL